MENEDLKFTCQLCGKQFDPDPDTMVETGISGACPCCETGLTEAEADELLESGEAFTADQLAAMSEYELSERGLTLADREMLLAGEAVTTGAACICKACQDSLDQEGLE